MALTPRRRFRCRPGLCKQAPQLAPDDDNIANLTETWRLSRLALQFESLDKVQVLYNSTAYKETATNIPRSVSLPSRASAIGRTIATRRRLQTTAPCLRKKNGRHQASHRFREGPLLRRPGPLAEALDQKIDERPDL